MLDCLCLAPKKKMARLELIPDNSSISSCFLFTSFDFMFSDMSSLAITITHNSWFSLFFIIAKTSKHNVCVSMLFRVGTGLKSFSLGSGQSSRKPRGLSKMNCVMRLNYVVEFYCLSKLF